jgi:uncharacterized RmlC-like cupin family protein
MVKLPGDFIFAPPFVRYQKINASQNESLECILVRSVMAHKKFRRTTQPRVPCAYRAKF